ncbi:DUF2333 family protein [Thiocapsa bogorovii]|uniref:DUF2333 family protein n=1 Tax=Thiocapsa bogorovii TaxID=521689 RepID=UPI001E30AA89|nr:DUF2333 family protein [Thiocapsa bogorovii]UHD14616.1 DUF2333 family protein [Thiocapsa bogorovii]
MDAEFKTRTPQLKNRVVKVAKYYHPHTWKEKGLWWTAGLFLVTYLVVMVILSLLWSRSPGSIDVNEIAMQQVEQDSTKLVPGTMTTTAAIGIAETLLNKSGGYLTNDIAPPGIFLDNIPNWEFGALTELRDLSRALRNDFSRAQTQSVEDVDLQIAEPKFNYDSQSWIFPSSESEYRDGIAALHRYLTRLGDDKNGDGEFFARADNLAAYLQVVAKRLGSLAQRLSYAVGQAPLDTALAGDAAATQASPGARQTWNKTPWLEIDDVFFEARGYTWALLRTLTAMEADFGPVLEDKNALVSLKQIVRELENTQDMIWSPMILNGTGFGPMSNHSLVMASYISRANAAIIDLRRLLIEG